MERNRPYATVRLHGGGGEGGGAGRFPLGAGGEEDEVGGLAVDEGAVDLGAEAEGRAGAVELGEQVLDRVGPAAAGRQRRQVGEAGITTAGVTLHVGAGTFQPVRAQVDTMTRFTASSSASTIRDVSSYIS